jgi:hypothetical protein
MDRRGADGYVLVFAPGADNAGMIARRLRDAGVGCLVAADADEFAAVLTDRGDQVATVVVTALGVRSGAGAAIVRFRQAEPAWSALPVVLLAPPGGVVVPPWAHTTLVTQPTTGRQLVDVVIAPSKRAATSTCSRAGATSCSGPHSWTR